MYQIIGRRLGWHSFNETLSESSSECCGSFRHFLGIKFMILNDFLIVSWDVRFCSARVPEAQRQVLPKPHFEVHVSKNLVTKSISYLKITYWFGSFRAHFPTNRCIIIIFEYFLKRHKNIHNLFTQEVILKWQYVKS